MVPVGIETREFKVPGGGSVTARKLSNSQFARAEAAAEGSRMLIVEYVFRQAVVAADLPGVVVKRGRDPGAPLIPAMVGVEVFDAVPLWLASDVAAWAGPGLDEEQAGNSPGPPGPSSA